MDMNDDNIDLQDLLNEVPVAPEPAVAPVPAAPAPASLSPFLHRIPVTLTLEAGSARVTLQELAELAPESVVALNTAVGEPLTIKVNGTTIGKGEVVIMGESYGLKVIELNADISALAA